MLQVRLSKGSDRMAGIAMGRAANGWDLVYMNEFGIDVADKALTFREFFGIDMPASYGVGLPEGIQRRVQHDAVLCEEIGALGRVTDRRMEEISHITTTNEGSSDLVWDLYQSLMIVANISPGGESNVDELAKIVMNLLGFNRISAHVYFLRNEPLDLMIAGENKSVRPDLVMSIVTPHLEKKILLVQEDKSVTAGPRAHGALPQLVAETLASYKRNRSFKFMQKQTAQTMYGIVLLGALPVFYKIPVDDKLLDTVASGLKARSITNVIQWCSPVTDGELPLPTDFTTIVTNTDSFITYLRSYEALRRLVASEVAQSYEALRQLTEST